VVLAAAIGTTLDAGAAEAGATEAVPTEAGPAEGGAEGGAAGGAEGAALNAAARADSVEDGSGVLVAGVLGRTEGTGVDSGEAALEDGNGVDSADTEGGGVLETRSASSLRLGLR